ncbi:AsnC/Lrp family transcriptional regulator [Alkalihalophilus pseudofirmus OF4]|uniref:AsnC/Lrp family transcriptional regulator n=3 Tax=Alkalihalophilus TaxID=2893060 RepID=D3FYV9_ALKPO|nr:MULTISPECIES: Lrp/AsnC family transcriptional regulator [Alkalihalophilus]ADC48992.1 AsnC/Lrp family transcriptional regulator [Alkalihalophilus pseudofirmus OF4]ERN52181.1 AsnC family transcriptional regulator [Alkalihalophilus marmarensis DSM 21297]MDV2886095.1 Lrp/AsnC family transcriptional regulator [Alkalihalophilus pseudofirmus]MED1600107.1 Lrp/AsnC family transcriptional regulator [Alkalihalophilus marmarensis]OLS35390.1 AsnC family transcriptional regulator [Alkalihalophilus pseudo
MESKAIDILHIIEENGRVSIPTLAKMVDASEEEVKGLLKKLEDDHIILSYSAVIDWSKVDQNEGVTAMIDVKVTPQRGVGFDQVAERIYRFPEVKALYLMSGAYDLSVVIEGKTMSEIARFVSEKLSTVDSVLSTTTHFQLKKYKHDGVVFGEGEEDRRIVVAP